MTASSSRIHHGDDLVGFIGRRNPTKDHSEYAGPKYLNTRTTAAFTKGEQLFGLTEGAAALAAGARPVLVEGPFDAIAVTLATQGRAVGIAPLGTAFTQQQAARLKPVLREEPSRVVVATDGDLAGWTSAKGAYWILCAHGADPRHLRLPDGLDPADLHTKSPHQLASLINHALPLATSMVDDLIEHRVDESPATRLRLVRETAQIIGALPPQQWLPHITHVLEHVDAPPGALHLEVADAGSAWSADPVSAARPPIAAMSSIPVRARNPEPPVTRVGHVEPTRPEDVVRPNAHAPHAPRA